MDFDAESKGILVDITYKGDMLNLYIPQPSFDRVGECIDLFGYLFDNFKKFSSILRLSKDLDLIIKKVSKQESNPQLKASVDALFQDAMLGLKALNKFEGMDLDEGIGLYNRLDKDTKAILKAQFLFTYALLRYATAEMLEEGLSEFCTALTYEEYRERFLKYTEMGQKKSLKAKTKKG